MRMPWENAKITESRVQTDNNTKCVGKMQIVVTSPGRLSQSADCKCVSSCFIVSVSVAVVRLTSGWSSALISELTDEVLTSGGCFCEGR